MLKAANSPNTDLFNPLDPKARNSDFQIYYFLYKLSQ